MASAVNSASFHFFPWNRKSTKKILLENTNIRNSLSVTKQPETRKKQRRVLILLVYEFTAFVSQRLLLKRRYYAKKIISIPKVKWRRQRRLLARNYSDWYTQMNWTNNTVFRSFHVFGSWGRQSVRLSNNLWFATTTPATKKNKKTVRASNYCRRRVDSVCFAEQDGK